MNDSTKRSLRTGFDSMVGLIATIVVLVPATQDFLTAVGLEQFNSYVALAGVWAVAATVLASKVRNALEDKGTIPAFGKTVAVDSRGSHEAEYSGE